MNTTLEIEDSEEYRMNKLNEKSKRSMKVRIISSIVFGAITIPAVILGGWFIFCLALVLVFIGIYEIVKTGQDKLNVLILILSYIFAISFVVWPFIKQKDLMNSIFVNNTFYMSIGNYSISLIGLLGYLLLLFFIALIDKKFMPTNVFYLFTMVFLFSISLLSLLFLRYFPSSPNLTLNFNGTVEGYIANSEQGVSVLNTDLRSCVLFFFIIIGTYMNDTGAYFTGILFGKHKMIERISPNKTWEGFVGGILFSFCFSLSYAAIFEFGLNIPLLPNIISFVNHPEFGDSLFSQPFWFVLLLSFIMPITANLGDLLFSAVKRQYNIKDYGNIMPGHGGVLDRFDSLLVTFSVCSLLIIMIASKCNFILA